MFQEDIYKTFLFITSCKSFQSIHLKKKKKKKKAISPNVSELSLGRETLETVNRAIEGIFLKHIRWSAIQSQTISK